jgi:hypothetical protein
MTFAIKAEISDASVETFAFTARTRSVGIRQSEREIDDAGVNTGRSTHSTPYRSSRSRQPRGREN